MSNDNAIEALLEKRQEKYGDAWIVPGEMAKLVDLTKVADMNFLYVFMVILSKLVRITSTPSDIDHWKDIAGYATLVFQHLEKLEDANANRAEGELARNDDEMPF